MTSKRDEVYKYILQYKINTNGESPTIREIGKACGIKSTCNVRYHLQKLEESNLIKRTMRSTDKTRATLLEVVGSRWIPPENY